MMLLRRKSAWVKTMGTSSSNPERQGPRSRIRPGGRGALVLRVTIQSLNAAAFGKGPAGGLVSNMISGKGPWLMSPTDAMSLFLLKNLVQRTDELGAWILFEPAQVLENPM